MITQMVAVQWKKLQQGGWPSPSTGWGERRADREMMNTEKQTINTVGPVTADQTHAAQEPAESVQTGKTTDYRREETQS